MVATALAAASVTESAASPSSDPTHWPIHMPSGPASSKPRCSVSNIFTLAIPDARRDPYSPAVHFCHRSLK
jgi:hypothetical protein